MVLRALRWIAGGIGAVLIALGSGVYALDWFAAGYDLPALLIASIGIVPGALWLLELAELVEKLWSPPQGPRT